MKSDKQQSCTARLNTCHHLRAKPRLKCLVFHPTLLSILRKGLRKIRRNSISKWKQRTRVPWANMDQYSVKSPSSKMGSRLSAEPEMQCCRSQSASQWKPPRTQPARTERQTHQSVCVESRAQVLFRTRKHLIQSSTTNQWLCINPPTSSRC